jgi:stearoyl-CoA desaturase (delta-9 desaturase)
MTTVPAVSGTPPAQPSMPKRQPEPLTLGARPAGNEVMVKVFVVVPFLALLGALPFAWGWG